MRLRIGCWRAFLLDGALALRAERNRKRELRKLWARYTSSPISYGEARRLMTRIMLLEHSGDA